MCRSSEWNQTDGSDGAGRGFVELESPLSGADSNARQWFVLPAHAVTLERRRRGKGSYSGVGHALHRSWPQRTEQCNLQVF